MSNRSNNLAPEAAAWIERLDLVPHPEGGYFRRHFTSASTVATAAGSSGPCATAIYYLLSGVAVSRLHSLARQEELWMWHAGGPLTVVELLAGTPPRVRTTELGPASGVLCHAVCPGTSFGALLPPGSSWSLVSCVVTPGFDFADWRLEPAPDATVLAALTPAEVAVLDRITPPQ